MSSRFEWETEEELLLQEQQAIQAMIGRPTVNGLRTEAGFLHLYAPLYGYQRLVVHEYPSCNFAAWINKS